MISFLKKMLPERVYYKYYPSGAVEEEGLVQDGKWHGWHKEYQRNGALRAKYNCKNGKIDGPYEEYYENGQLSIKCTYKDGEEVGVYESYREDGRLWTRSNYKGGESRPELYEEYDEDGNLCRKVSFKNDTIENEEDYYPNGQLKMKGHRVNRQWVEEKYDEDGHLVSKESYGKRQEFYPNGQLKKEEIRKFGNQWLLTKENKEDGTPVPPEQLLSDVVEKEEEYSAIDEDWDVTTTHYTVDGYGRKQGSSQTYYNDKLIGECTYKDGIKEGPYKNYDYNGNLTEQGTYKNGQKVKEGELVWKTYNNASKEDRLRLEKSRNKGR